ncbi:MAG: membrane-bound lytic murein transglycosylase MltF [Gammaproteobacteria bacterium]|jgi:membrane-bound lytic murein transglycosylase F
MRADPTPEIRLLRAVLFVIIASTLCTCSQAPSVLERIRSAGELRFVTRNSPTTYYLGPGEPRGIEYELARKFADRLGVALRIMTASQPGQVVPTLIRGSADIAATGLAVDADNRRESVELGPSYQHSLQQVIYKRGNRRPRGVEDLIGADIAVIADSDYSAALNELGRSRPGLEWTEHDDASVEDLVRRVTEGEFDYTVVDSNLFAILRQFHPEARAAFSLSEAKPIAWALPDHAGDLREAVAAFFAEIKATGELHSITDKYYAAARNFDYVGSRAFVRHSRSRLPALRQAFEATGRSSGFDWRLLAAIAYQESHWRADAVSPTGVRGLMMLTEHAASAVNVSDRTDPEQSIAGGAKYLQRMLDKLPTRIAASDRLWMALAAYNIGFGHLEDARIITQINGGNPDSWADVRRHLPLLADEQWHSRVRRGYARGDVPVEYVDNVKRYYQLLQWLDDTAPRDHAVFAVERSETGVPAETESSTLEEPADGERTAAARQPLSDDAEKTL